MVIKFPPEVFSTFSMVNILLLIRLNILIFLPGSSTALLFLKSPMSSVRFSPSNFFTVVRYTFSPTLTLRELSPRFAVRQMETDGLFTGETVKRSLPSLWMTSTMSGERFITLISRINDCALNGSRIVRKRVGSRNSVLRRKKR